MSSVAIPRLLTIREAAEFLGVSTASLRKWSAWCRTTGSAIRSGSTWTS